MADERWCSNRNPRAKPLDKATASSDNQSTQIKNEVFNV